MILGVKRLRYRNARYTLTKLGYCRNGEMLVASPHKILHSIESALLLAISFNYIVPAHNIEITDLCQGTKCTNKTKHVSIDSEWLKICFLRT